MPGACSLQPRVRLLLSYGKPAVPCRDEIASSLVRTAKMLSTSASVTAPEPLESAPMGGWVYKATQNSDLFVHRCASSSVWNTHALVIHGMVVLVPAQPIQGHLVPRRHGSTMVRVSACTCAAGGWKSSSRACFGHTTTLKRTKRTASPGTLTASVSWCPRQPRTYVRPSQSLCEGEAPGEAGWWQGWRNLNVRNHG